MRKMVIPYQRRQSDLSSRLEAATNTPPTPPSAGHCVHAGLSCSVLPEGK